MSVDWTIFDEFPENTCYCRCETIYRSHAKIVKKGKKLVMVSRKPCPNCERTEGHLRRVSSDPEIMTIKKEETNVT